jgi:hypothetical protein
MPVSILQMPVTVLQFAMAFVQREKCPYVIMNSIVA